MISIKIILQNTFYSIIYGLTAQTMIIMIEDINNYYKKRPLNIFSLKRLILHPLLPISMVLGIARQYTQIPLLDYLNKKMYETK